MAKSQSSAIIQYVNPSQTPWVPLIAPRGEWISRSVFFWGVVSESMNELLYSLYYTVKTPNGGHRLSDPGRIGGLNYTVILLLFHGVSPGELEGPWATPRFTPHGFGVLEVSPIPEMMRQIAANERGHKT